MVCNVGYPLPPWGYFGRKILAFKGLRWDGACKIFIIDELGAKSPESIS
jgi:hypothetical protein